MPDDMIGHNTDHSDDSQAQDDKGVRIAIRRAGPEFRRSIIDMIANEFPEDLAQALQNSSHVKHFVLGGALAMGPDMQFHFQPGGIVPINNGGEPITPCETDVTQEADPCYCCGETLEHGPGEATPDQCPNQLCASHAVRRVTSPASMIQQPSRGSSCRPGPKAVTKA